MNSLWRIFLERITNSRALAHPWPPSPTACSTNPYVHASWCTLAGLSDKTFASYYHAFSIQEDHRSCAAAFLKNNIHADSTRHIADKFPCPRPQYQQILTPALMIVIMTEKYTFHLYITWNNGIQLTFELGQSYGTAWALLERLVVAIGHFFSTLHMIRSIIIGGHTLGRGTKFGLWVLYKCIFRVGCN